MGDPRGFLKHNRELPVRRPVPVRLRDWREVYEDFPSGKLQEQAARCMDCGVPFCNEGCPLGNLIPDWNDLVYRHHWRTAIEKLHATNNFPEFTGKLCPAPCEAACVLGINEPPVTIKQVEVEIIDKAWKEGWVTPETPSIATDKSVAVIGSGPAGLAAAQQLTRAGHHVVVFERDDRLGGLLRYGIPEFKMEKRYLDRRLEQMRAEGTHFRTNINVGVDISAEQLQSKFDAIILACGARAWRDLPIPGRELNGIHQAMTYLTHANRVVLGDINQSPISAEGKHTIIIGGGDTGADCLGTAHRQNAASIRQFEIMPKPPETRPNNNPWPTWPMIYQVSSAHEEGGQRDYAISTTKFLGNTNGSVSALETVRVERKFENGRMFFEPITNTQETIKADLVLLAMGFVGTERGSLIDQFKVKLTERGDVARNENWATNVPGVYVCGDMGRGQSLIVWAISEGRSCAAAVDEALTGSTSLPSVISPTSTPLR